MSRWLCVQVEGGFVQGMGWTCLEELVWGDEDHPWLPPGVLHTRGPGAPLPFNPFYFICFRVQRFISRFSWYDLGCRVTSCCYRPELHADAAVRAACCQRQTLDQSVSKSSRTESTVWKAAIKLNDTGCVQKGALIRPPIRKHPNVKGQKCSPRILGLGLDIIVRMLNSMLYS